MASILCVGNITLDIVNHVPHYPAEDEEMRATANERRSGGNAANTALILAQFGHQLTLAGTLARDESGQWLRRRFDAAGIDTSALIEHRGTTPTSYILLNEANGSRTIVHYRDLPELRHTDIAGHLSRNYDWVHFEGRNPDALEQMMRTTHDSGNRISLEAEKPRPGLEQLFPLADVIMFSRPWAEATGHGSAGSLLQTICDRHPGKLLTCTWGAAGAWYCDQSGEIRHTAPPAIEHAVDTIAAGDSFNAGLIHSLTTGSNLHKAVTDATTLASRKVEQIGIDDLKPNSTG